MLARPDDTHTHVQFFIYTLATAGDTTCDVSSIGTFIAFRSSDITTDFCVRDRGGILPPPAEQVRKAKTWLDECLQGHEKCQNNQHPQTYPTRLLELSGTGVRLIETAEQRPTGPYVALSYCWGPNPKFCRLTTDNYQELRGRGILYGELPIAFRQVIELMEGLEIRYIWIDALCIIQSGPNSTADWLVECRKMASVYSMSLLNISLSSVSSPEDDYRAPSSPSAIPPLEIETVNLVKGSGRIKCTLVDWDYYKDAHYSQPLASRAWTLQERIISPRVLNLSRPEMFWECNGHISCESFPRGIETPIALLQQQCKGPFDGMTPEALADAWFDIEEDYKRRHLTFPEKDKLLALSSVASHVAEAMDDIYVAGHFLKTLPWNLTWSTKSYKPFTERPSGTCRRCPISSIGSDDNIHSSLPSWSWASIDGPTFNTRPGRCSDMADLEAYTLELLDKNHPTGQILSASLTISAFCVEMIWTLDKPVIQHVLEKFKLEVVFDDPVDQLHNGDRCTLAMLVNVVTPPDPDEELDDESLEPAEKIPDSDVFTYPGVRGLVLNTVPGEQRQIYRRIGVFELFAKRRGRLALGTDAIKSKLRVKRTLVLI